MLERLPGLLSGGPSPQPKDPTGAGEGAGEGAGGPPQAAPPSGEAQAPTDPARDAAARANFELVKDHAEAFAGARMLSVLGI